MGCVKILIVEMDDQVRHCPLDQQVPLGTDGRARPGAKLIADAPIARAGKKALGLRAVIQDQPFEILHSLAQRIGML